jgi:DNA-binding transcriptional ArsR family regulator
MRPADVGRDQDRSALRQSDGRRESATRPSWRYDLEKSIDILLPMGKRPATPDEARALANPLRLRILRLCLDEALTNKEIADRLGRDPGTTLHHVRLLVATDFLAGEEVRHGTSGALEKPYRATRKSWILDVTEPGTREELNLAVVDAFRSELATRPDGVINMSRLGVRLTPDNVAELETRIDELVADFKERDSPDGEPLGMLFAVHRRG